MLSSEYLTQNFQEPSGYSERFQSDVFRRLYNQWHEDGVVKAKDFGPVRSSSLRCRS